MYATTNNISPQVGGPTTAVVDYNSYIPSTHHRERLTAFYQQYDQTKLSKIDGALERFQGREDEMWGQLRQKYNEEPGHQEKLKLVEFFLRKDPPQVANVHVVVIPYIGQFEVMWKNLKEKYGE